MYIMLKKEISDVHESVQVKHESNFCAMNYTFLEEKKLFYL